MRQFMRVDRALGAEMERLRVLGRGKEFDERVRARFDTLRDIRRLMLDPLETGVPGA